jgi:hypothetical protein
MRTSKELCAFGRAKGARDLDISKIVVLEITGCSRISGPLDQSTFCNDDWKNSTHVARIFHGDGIVLKKFSRIGQSIPLSIQLISIEIN